MKTITCLLLTIATMFVTFPALSKVDIEKSPLIIAMSNDTYPFQFVDENNRPSGLLVDIWLEWSKQTKTQVIFKPADWVTSLRDLEQGKADVHIGMAKTNARDEMYVFSPKIASVNSYLYLNYQLTIPQSFSDIIPYKIGVVKGAAQIEILKALEPKLTFIYFDNRTELLKAVIDEEVLVFVGLEGFLRESQINNTISVKYPLENRKLITSFSLYPALKKEKLALTSNITSGFESINPDVLEEHRYKWLGNLRYQNDIVIAMQTGVEPFANIGTDGFPHGLLIDIWKLWSEKTGLPIRFVAGSMKQSIDNVKRGIADVHLGYPESASMQTGLNRAHTIYRVSSRLFSFEQPLQSLDELKGKIVAVSPTSPYLSELLDSLPESEIRYYHSVDSMIEASKTGEINAFVAAAAWTQHYLLLNHNWEQFHQYMELEFKTDLYALNRASQQGFAQRIAAGFTLISQTELAQIERKWMLNPEDRIYKSQQRLINLTPVQQRIIDEIGTVKVGYLRNWRPMEYQEAGQYAGINSEIVNIIANELGLEIETQVFDEWSNLLDALINGDVAIAGSVAKTPEREYQLSFSDSYWPSPWGLVTSLNSVNSYSLDDLSGQRIAVIEGYHIVGDLMRKYPSLKLILVPDSGAGLRAVNQGQADVFIDKVVNLNNDIRGGQFSNLKMSMLVDFAEQRSHFGVHHSKEALLPLINAVLANIDATRQQQIHQKWASETIEFGREEYENKIKISILLFSTLFIVAIIALLANRRLRKEVARRIEAENKMAHFAKHDSLTQLPNRALIEDRLEQAILSHVRDTAQFAVVFIDLDGFKLVNDRYGHQVGDKLLVHVSEVLTNGIRRSDTVGRLGGDEFVIILNDIKDLKSVNDVTENLLASLSKPFVINQQALSAPASIGIAIYPKDGDCIDALLKTADKQMYRAKNAGGRAYRST
ncbi:transporter substrate-binding domain-containing protein [uncultured Shewanella sp.]|uniref:diguanylate cyclase domain-containing protein n=1 Tax=uncultured Shewanella sp. TaxID=173975 RepID=UPI00262CE954|nr:transporter substrate-binding domain-containing protein [uncultured Shewanella sp.]